MDKFDISSFIDILTPEKATEDLVSRFKTRRKEAKLSQSALASRSGVSYASLRRFETTGEISLNSLMRLAVTLDCLEDFGQLFAHRKITDLKDYE